MGVSVGVMRVTEIYYPFTHESLRLAYYSHHRVLVGTDTVPKPKLEQEAGVWTRRGEVDFLLWQTARDPSLREWLDARGHAEELDVQGHQFLLYHLPSQTAPGDERS